MDLHYCTTHLNTHEKCIKYLEQLRWNDIPICPYCGSLKSSPKGLRYTCSGCSRSYSVTVGTVFQHTKLPLNKWFIALTLLLSAKKGISAMQLSRHISVNKNTAWLLQMKLRVALEDDQLKGNPTGDLINRLIKFRRRNKRTFPRPRIRFSFRIGSWSKGETNGSYLKRAIYGQYHQIDEYFLHRYIDEINFKLSVRNALDRGYGALMKRILF